MKLKKTLILSVIVALITLFCNAQQIFCGEIQYKQIKKLSKLYEQDFLMKFNNKESYSEEINIKLTEDRNEKKVSERGLTETTIIGRKNLNPEFFYNNKSAFYFSEPLLIENQTLIVKEDSHQWKWILNKETKNIGNFICQKATIKFRGRNYIAWFTNEIPVPFGPWKFQGLSGLILEVYDTDKVFHIITNKVRIEKTLDCSINFDKTQLKGAITIVEYRKEKEKIINTIFAKLSSKMPKGSSPLKWDKNCEDCPKGLEIFDEEN